MSTKALYGILIKRAQEDNITQRVNHTYGTWNGHKRLFDRAYTWPHRIEKPIADRPYQGEQAVAFGKYNPSYNWAAKRVEVRPDVAQPGMVHELAHAYDSELGIRDPEDATFVERFSPQLDQYNQHLEQAAAPINKELKVLWGKNRFDVQHELERKEDQLEQVKQKAIKDWHTQHPSYASDLKRYERLLREENDRHEGRYGGRYEPEIPAMAAETAFHMNSGVPPLGDAKGARWLYDYMQKHGPRVSLDQPDREREDAIRSWMSKIRGDTELGRRYQDWLRAQDEEPWHWKYNM